MGTDQRSSDAPAARAGRHQRARPGTSRSNAQAEAPRSAGALGVHPVWTGRRVRAYALEQCRRRPTGARDSRSAGAREGRCGFWEARVGDESSVASIGEAYSGRSRAPQRTETGATADGDDVTLLRGSHIQRPAAARSAERA
jgi:hypothetical protein